jgi:transposase
MILKTRALLVRQQTPAINALRAHLSEMGIVPGAALPICGSGRNRA